MNYDKFNFYLRGADYLYYKNKDVFEREQTARNSYVLNQDHISLNPLDFKTACENPMYNPQPTVMGLVLGFLYPFQYRLYKELALYSLIVLCLNLSIFFLFGAYSTLFSYVSFLGYYLFFTFYTRVLWARKIHQYLFTHPEATKNQILTRFRPHHIITTCTLGFVYILLILWGSIYFVAEYFKIFHL